MIPNTPLHYLFTRVTILCLRATAPLSVLYCFCYLVGFRIIPWSLEIIAGVEAVFYVLVSLPIQYALNKSSPRIKVLSRKERQELFEKCCASIPNMATFIRVWFKEAELSSLRREDVKDFLAWGFLYKSEVTANDDEELEEYLTEIETILGRKFVAGRGPCKPSMVSTDPVVFQHKGFLFYSMAIGANDVMTYVAMKRMAFEHYRLTFARSFTVFPFRPHTVFSEAISPAKHLSYWHRPHTATKKLPILFIHGVGTGLTTYTKFLKNFIDNDTKEDGQIGIIVLEIMSIAMRMTTPTLHRDEILREILSILDHHGWRKCVIVAVSYGTTIATHLQRCLETKNRIGTMLLIDPTAEDGQLQYFVSTDIGIAYTITRLFDWSENVLWKDEMKGRTMTVVLSGRDIIVDTVGLRKYLLEDNELGAREYQGCGFERGQKPEIRDVGLHLLWYNDFNHGDIFNSQKDVETLVDVAHRYCKM